MQFMRRIAQKRDDIIVGRARPHLEEGEEVLQWVRARSPDRRGEGFVFLTERRVVVYWTGQNDDHTSIAWEEMTAWGLHEEDPRGPVLGLGSEEELVYVQLRVGTQGMAAQVRDFLALFGELAPYPKRKLNPSGDLGDIHEGDVTIRPERRGVAGHTRRVVVSIIGVMLIVIAAIIIPLPGPWSFVLTLGGLAILSSEYDWAKDVRDWVRDRYRDAAERIKRRKRS
jgi:uncharacterized protein (TIGR02611 family)